jgi:NAD-dependent DNA ligase
MVTIGRRGGKIGGAVNKNTTVLVVKDKSKMTSVKAIKAAALGVKVLTVDKFADSYGIQLSENV